MTQLSRRNVVIGGASIAATATLLGCGRKVQSDANGSGVESAEAHFPNYPPDVLPLNLPPSSPNKALTDSDPYVDELGRGFDSVFDETKMFFVTGEVIRSDYNPTTGDARDSLAYELLESQDSYYAFTKKSARAKARYKLFSGSGRASKTSEKTSNSYSLHICALARRFDPMHSLKNGTVALTEEGERLYRRYKDRPGELIKLLGDSYVAGVLPGAELLLDIRFETSSKTARGNASAALRLSYGKLASGSASYGQVINSASSVKRVTVNITGVDGLPIPRLYTAEEANQLIQQFLRNTDVATTAAYMNYRPIRELTRNGRPLDFVDYEVLSRRERFVSEAEAQLEYLDRVEADAVYVVGNENEFDSNTLDRARSDLPAIKTARNRIFDIGEAAYGRFRNTGSHDFDYRVFETISPTFQTYEQIEPAKPTPAPTPRPKAEPRSRCNGSCRDGPIRG